MTTEVIIEADALQMTYGEIQALRGVSFQIHKGEILGLLGPNGAGKSTTIKILTTYLYPTSGRARLLGYDIFEAPEKIRERIGYLPENTPLYLDMSAEDYLSFVGKARGLKGSLLAKRLEWVLEHCHLREVKKMILFELSKGYRQRVGLAQALIHDPEILILDEPTGGLDPLQILEIRKLLKSLAKEKTIIFSTHILQEVEAIADRLILIHRGTLLAQGSVQEVRNQHTSLENAFIHLVQEAMV